MYYCIYIVSRELYYQFCAMTRLLIAQTWQRQVKQICTWGHCCNIDQLPLLQQIWQTTQSQSYLAYKIFVYTMLPYCQRSSIRSCAEKFSQQKSVKRSTSSSSPFFTSTFSPSCQRSSIYEKLCLNLIDLQSGLCCTIDELNFK